MSAIQITSNKDNSIWDLHIEIFDDKFRFMISNDNQKYESYNFHFQEVTLDYFYTDVVDFDVQKKIVNLILETNTNFTKRQIWMKKSIYKTPENEILGYHITDESKKEFVVYVEMKKM